MKVLFILCFMLLSVSSANGDTFTCTGIQGGYNGPDIPFIKPYPLGSGSTFTFWGSNARPVVNSVSRNVSDDETKELLAALDGRVGIVRKIIVGGYTMTFYQDDRVWWGLSYDGNIEYGLPFNILPNPDYPSAVDMILSNNASDVVTRSFKVVETAEFYESGATRPSNKSEIMLDIPSSPSNPFLEGVLDITHSWTSIMGLSSPSPLLINGGDMYNYYTTQMSCRRLALPIQLTLTSTELDYGVMATDSAPKRYQLEWGIRGSPVGADLSVQVRLDAPPENITGDYFILGGARLDITSAYTGDPYLPGVTKHIKLGYTRLNLTLDPKNGVTGSHILPLTLTVSMD